MEKPTITLLLLLTLAATAYAENTQPFNIQPGTNFTGERVIVRNASGGVVGEQSWGPFTSTNFDAPYFTNVSATYTLPVYYDVLYNVSYQFENASGWNLGATNITTYLGRGLVTSGPFNISTNSHIGGNLNVTGNLYIPNVEYANNITGDTNKILLKIENVNNTVSNYGKLYVASSSIAKAADQAQRGIVFDAMVNGTGYRTGLLEPLVFKSTIVGGSSPPFSPTAINQKGVLFDINMIGTGSQGVIINELQGVKYGVVLSGTTGCLAGGWQSIILNDIRVNNLSVSGSFPFIANNNYLLFNGTGTTFFPTAARGLDFQIEMLNHKIGDVSFFFPELLLNSNSAITNVYGSNLAWADPDNINVTGTAYGSYISMNYFNNTYGSYVNVGNVPANGRAYSYFANSADAAFLDNVNVGTLTPLNVNSNGDDLWVSGDAGIGNLLNVTTSIENAGNFKITSEGGEAIRVNVTQAVTQGTVLKVNSTTANMFSPVAVDDDMPVCTVYDSSISANTRGWCTVSGRGYALVTAQNNLGDVCYVSASVAGKVDCAASIPAVVNHNREIGHAFVVNNTAGLTQAVLHWN
jgi:hypothetical protein